MTSSPLATADPALARVTDLDDVREKWTALAPLTGNVFSTWEWASLWWRHYGEGRRLAVFAADAGDGRIVAIVPLYEWAARPVRVGRFLGHGPADQLGLVCAPPDRAAGVASFKRAIRLAGFDLALAEVLPGDVDWSELLGSRLLMSEASPVLSLDRGWSEILAARSANFRQQVHRRERRLRERYSLRFRLASDVERLDEDFSRFVTLHLERWGGSSAFVRWERFLREFTWVAFERGWLRLWFLELDGVTVGAWLGFRFGGVESYYQAGRSPAYGDDSVGFVLLVHSVREAAADGMREYRFLRGGEAFKGRFADGDARVETHALARGARGRAGMGVARASIRSTTLRALLRAVAGRSGPRM
jgi:CelD/BcsL family acetyltransferase involved in cellulose biosynthesis